MAAVTSTTESWIRPSVVVDDFVDFAKKGSGAQDLFETIENVFEWSEQLQINPKYSRRAAHTAHVANQTLSVPLFLGSVGELKNNFQAYVNSDDADAAGKVFDSTLVTGVHGAKSAFTLDALGIVSFKEMMAGITTVFWSCLFVLDAKGIYKEVGETRLLQKNLEVTTDPKLRKIYEHKINNSYLKTLQHAVIAVAMAPLALLSMLYGALVSPVVMLSLTTAWCALNFTTYFYGKAIERWVCIELHHLFLWKSH